MEITIDQAFQQAIEAHKSGKFQEAERYYLAILNAQPLNSNANHHLGILLIQLGKSDLGIPHLRLAIENNPKVEQYWISYIDALINENEFGIAEKVLGQAKNFALSSKYFEKLNDMLICQASKVESCASSKKIDKSKITLANNPSRNELETLLTLYGSEQYEIANKLAYEFTQNYPNHPFGWKIFAATLLYTGRLQESIIYGQKIIELSPNDAEARNILGDSFKTLGRLKEAESTYREAIELKPNFSQAYCNLADVLREMKNFDAAVFNYKKAIDIQPVFLEAFNNLAVVLVELGKLEEAEANFNKALELKPDFLDVLLNFSALLILMNKRMEAKRCLKKLIILDPTNHGKPASVDLAILSYLDGDLKTADILLSSSKNIIKHQAKYKNEFIYWRYLCRLLNWHALNPGFEDPQKCKKIYMIGESHSLASNSMVINQLQENFYCSTFWIRGCKQRHFSVLESNKFKFSFEKIVTNLPKKSLITMFVGEIDCRINDGLIPYLKKNPNIIMVDAVSSTVKGYLSYLSTINEPLSHHLIISGIPAPNIDFSLISPEDTKLLISLIKLFNAVLKQETIKLGFGFLDTYALTNRGDGISNTEWHIDDYHLKPDAIQKLFSDYFFSRCNLQ